MLVTSPEYMFIFLPIVLIVYFLLNKFKLLKLSLCFLVAASLYFYAYFKVSNLGLILISVIFNYSIGSILAEKENCKINRKLAMVLGVLGNVLFLVYFKYSNFLLENINLLFHQQISYKNIALPLGISFFTFQQIAYVVDSYNEKIEKSDFLNYLLFVTFFPKIFAGPIIKYEEVMSQFANLKNKFINWENMSRGLFQFVVGLFKKVVIADTLSKFVAMGFDTHATLSTLEAWLVMLSYTFQIYYDFSGYTDMALGAAKMFNINLPQNFNNPYRALDIQDFWRRWHITLSRFLRDYIYIPLGGNRKGEFKTYRNLFFTFLIGGIWHGASWMFVMWGVLHGVGCVINRLWRKTNIELHKAFSWIITFLYLNLTWLFFRADNFSTVKRISKGLLGLNGFSIPKIYFPLIKFAPNISGLTEWEALLLFLIPILIIIIFVNIFRNNTTKFKPSLYYVLLITIMFLSVMYNIVKPDYSSPFIYFKF